jgi:hypothetical protein
MTEEKKQGGQAILIIAMLLLVIVILIALAVDGGNAWAQHQLAQNAVDAGVLAGIQAMAMEFEKDEVTLLESELFQIVVDYTTKNGIPADYVDAWYTDINGDRLQKVDEIGGEKVPKFILDPVGKKHQVNGLEVWGDRHYDTFFIRVVGRDTMVSGAESTGWVWCGVCAGELLFPATIASETFSETGGYPLLNTHYIIWDNEKDFPGGFGWVHWGDVGEQPQNVDATTLQENIEDTHRSGLWNVGDWMPVGPGEVRSDGVKDQVEKKIVNEEVLFLPIHDYSCITLPESDPDYPEHGGCAPGANSEYRIEYFIGFIMTCIHFGPAQERGECTNDDWNSPDAWLEGYFVKIVSQLSEGVCPGGSVNVCTYKMRRPSVEP